MKPAFENIYCISDILGCSVPHTDLSQYAAVFTKKTSLFIVQSPCPATWPDISSPFRNSFTWTFFHPCALAHLYTNKSLPQPSDSLRSKAKVHGFFWKSLFRPKNVVYPLCLLPACQAVGSRRGMKPLSWKTAHVSDRDFTTQGESFCYLHLICAGGKYFYMEVVSLKSDYNSVKTWLVPENYLIFRHILKDMVVSTLKSPLHPPSLPFNNAVNNRACTAT